MLIAYGNPICLLHSQTALPSCWLAVAIDTNSAMVVGNGVHANYNVGLNLKIVMIKDTVPYVPNDGSSTCISLSDVGRNTVFIKPESIGDRRTPAIVPRFQTDDTHV